MERWEGYLAPSGEFVADGVWESWSASGVRCVYGHFSEGRHHGRRFEWGRDGELQSIVGYDEGQLVEYESENLTQHPDYATAAKLSQSGR